MRRAFTLIELLVVMTITGVLIGLAIPAVGVARQRADQLQCMTNLRSLNLALRLYMDTENDGIFPVAAPYVGRFRNANFTDVYGVIDPYLDAPPPRRAGPESDWNSGQPFACPVDDTVAGEFGYSYSFYPGVGMTSFLDPYVLFPERARPLTLTYDRGTRFNYVWVDADGWHPNGPIVLNHGFNGHLASFYDGSVDWAVRPALNHGPN